MKYLHTTTYKLYNKDNMKISIISDIHFSYKIIKKLDILTNHLNNIKPNYILIPGDLIDSIDITENKKEKNRILNWIKSLSKISKVIISLGNHDVCKKLKNKIEYKYNSEFYNEISSIDKVYLLDNNYYIDEFIYIAGITVSYSYYKKESPTILLNDLNKNKKIITNLPKDRLKILMIHSPVNLDNKNIQNELKEFDYFVCGHMHNGCVPPLLNELWNSTRGIIAPSGKLFFKGERNTLNKKEDKLIVNGPVTTFNTTYLIMQIFNIFYPIYNTVLEFNNNNEFIRKRKYHK